MAKKLKNARGSASTVTDGGNVELTEEQLAGVTGGADRISAGGDGSEVSENVTLNFAKVKYVYTPQK